MRKVGSGGVRESAVWSGEYRGVRKWGIGKVIMGSKL